MKITRTTTMEQLKKALGANAVAVKEADTNLYEQMVYTSKAMKEGKKVTKKDLADLVKDVMKVLGDKFVEPVLAEEAPATEKTEDVEKKAPAKKKVAPKKAETPAKESSLKTKKKGGITKAEKSEEVKTPATEVETSDEKKEAVKSAKKTGKKTPAKKVAPKSAVTPVTGTDKNDKTVQLASMFSETIEVEGETYKIAHDIKTMEDLHKAFEADEEIIFAYYWTKRHLRQFPYFNSWLGQPKEFKNDLDLVSIIYVSDEFKVAHGVSMYTEAPYSVLPVDMTEEDGLRLSGGIEFQIYRK